MGLHKSANIFLTLATLIKLNILNSWTKKINQIYNELTEQLLEQFKEQLTEHKINLLILNYLKFSN